MPELPNTKHEAFCQARFKGLSQLEAYKVAGYKPDDGAASRLSKEKPIIARIAELQRKMAARAEVTVEMICDHLDEAIKIARKAKSSGQMTAAAVAKAKLYGLMTERSVVSVTHNYAQMTEEELRFEIAAIHAEARALKPGVQH
jgi:hypothetical protein